MTILPDSIADVDSSFVEWALHDSGVLAGDAHIVGCELEYLGEGVGMLGDLARVSLRYEPECAGPASLIVKVPSTHEGNRARAMAYGFYEREARLYRHFEETGATGGLRVPRCWASPMDVDAGRFALVLEDLDGAGFEPADQVAGLQPDQAHAAVEALARFHARWWGATDADALTFLPASNSPVTKQAAGLFRESWSGFVERYGDCLPEGSIALGERVGACFEWLLDATADAPRTIVHTDFRLDNLFFSRGNGDADVAVIDWQLSTKGRGVYDVAYLLGQSMDSSLRAEHEHDVVRTWYEALTSSGVDGYSLDQTLDDYRRSAMVNLVIPVSLAYGMDHGNERGEALVRAISERSFRAAVELDAGALLP